MTKNEPNQNNTKGAKTSKKKSKNKIQADLKRFKTSQNEPKRCNITQNKIVTDQKWPKKYPNCPQNKPETSQSNPKQAEITKRPKIKSKLTRNASK